MICRESSLRMGIARTPITQLGKFSLIIGSDLLYERDQPGLLSVFIDCPKSRILSPFNGSVLTRCASTMPQGQITPKCDQLADEIP